MYFKNDKISIIVREMLQTIHLGSSKNINMRNCFTSDSQFMCFQNVIFVYSPVGLGHFWPDQHLIVVVKVVVNWFLKALQSIWLETHMLPLGKEWQDFDTAVMWEWWYISVLAWSGCSVVPALFATIGVSGWKYLSKLLQASYRWNMPWPQCTNGGSSVFLNIGSNIHPVCSFVQFSSI